MSIEFNFTGLHSIFVEAVKKHEPSIAFSVDDGIGKFVFLLFLVSDSKGNVAWDNLQLFIFLGRTQRMLTFKVFGNHFRKGDFRVWLKDWDEQAIRDELGLTDLTHGRAFVLSDFLMKLNSLMPATLSLESKIKTIKAVKPAVRTHCAEYLEDARKVYLLGVKHLPEGQKPREETLRKLFMLDAPATDIAVLIDHLKRLRWTVCWTAMEPQSDKFADAFRRVASIASQS